MSDSLPQTSSSTFLKPGFAMPEPNPNVRRKRRSKRGRGLSIRFLLTVTVFLALLFGVVREFRDHLDFLVGMTFWFIISGSIGMVFVFVRRRAALQEAFLALVAASRRVGLPVQAGAEAFARQCGSRGYRQRLIRFSREIENGMSVPEAATIVRGLIPRESHASFRVIDATSGSDRALERLIEIRNARIEAVTPLINMVLYFLYISIHFVFITSFLIEQILPKFNAIFVDFGSQSVSSMSPFIDFMSNSMFMNGFAFRFALIFILPIVFVYVLVLSRGGKGFGLFGMFVPWITAGERAMILRGMAETIRANSPVDETLKIFSDWSLRGLVRRKCRLARKAVIAGVGWIDALAGEGLLKSQEVPLLQAAGRSGDVGNTLEQLADMIQTRQWYRWRLITDFLNPILTMIFGIMIFCVCWTFFMPLVRLIQGLAS